MHLMDRTSSTDILSDKCMSLRLRHNELNELSCNKVYPLTASLLIDGLTPQYMVGVSGL